MGGYTDSKLNRFLGFDAAEEAVVYSVAVGYAALTGQEYPRPAFQSPCQNSVAWRKEQSAHAEGVV